MDYLSTNQNPSRLAPIGGLAGAQSTAANVPTERKPSQTEVAVQELSGQHARIEALVGELERRIGAVLLPAPPAQNGAQAEGPSSPLANKLFQEAAIVRGLAERIDSIISRVDL